MSSPYPAPNVHPIGGPRRPRTAAGSTLRAPAHLSKEAGAWWRETVRTYDLEPRHIRLLTMAAATWDRAEQARKLIDADGLVVLDRFGQQKTHPAVQVEKDSRTLYARLMRDLDLDGLASPTPRRGA